MRQRVLTGEDIEMVMFDQESGEWDVPALLQAITDYAAETDKVPVSIMYSNDDERQWFYAYFHI